MPTHLLFSILSTLLFATTLAVPLIQRQNHTTGESNSWQPAPGTASTCDTQSDKLISFTQGVLLSTALDNACSAMMPACAYPDRAGTQVCKATVDYALEGPKSSVQDVNVVDAYDNKHAGWNARCTSSLPPSSSLSSQL
jgi:hypothetical protein